METQCPVIKYEATQEPRGSIERYHFRILELNGRDGEGRVYYFHHCQVVQYCRSKTV